MVQPYWTEVNKEKERRERYDKEDDEVEEQQKFEQEQKPEMTSSTEEDNGEKEKPDQEAAVDTDGVIPIVLSDNNTEKPGVVFVLEKAFLEVVKVGQTYQLLNSYDHADFMSDISIDSADYRPDITHQALLMILDSPVNKAGRLKVVYVSTLKGVLFEVKPHAHIPRTYKRFAGLMVQLLLKLSISSLGGEKTLRVIKTPVSHHLPVNSHKIGLSFSSDNLVNMQKQYLANVCNDTDTVFVLGAMEHDRIEQRDYMDDFVSISRYPLSATYCISRICEAFSKTEEDNEEKENIEEGAAVNFFDQTAVDIDGLLFDNKPGVIFVLEKASLEVAKVGKTYQLLNSNDHANFLRTSNRNPADYRPDITHQALLMILDSPVNKAGRLKAVYVRTQTGVLFEVKTHVRLPRIYKKFTEVMLQLLQSLIVTEYDTEKLRVIKNPITDHLPSKSKKIGLSFSSDNFVNMQKQYLANVCNNTDTVFVIGAMAHGKIDCDYIDDLVAISEYPLSAAYCISRICEALSRQWNIV